MNPSRSPAQTSAPLSRAQRRRVRAELVAALRTAGLYAALPVVDAVLGRPQALTSDEAARELRALGVALDLARQLRRLRAAGGEGVHEVDREGHIGEGCRRPVATVRVTASGFFVAALSEESDLRTDARTARAASAV